MDKIQKDTPKKQHYVPQCLLKNFSFGEKNRIFAFDKIRGKKISTNVRDSASENGFYNLKINGEDHTLEHKLSNLESVAGAIIKKICDEEALSNITDEEHVDLCLFLSNLLLRVKSQRDWIGQINDVFANLFQEAGINPNDVENFDFLEKDDLSKVHTLFTYENTFDFAKILLEKRLVLRKAPNGSNFIISDNPVAIHNHRPREGRGNSGILLPGIEIQIPLSNKLSLSLFCPELISEYASILEKWDILKLMNPDIPKSSIDFVFRLINSMEKKEALVIEPKNVVFSNKLQIIQSLNYVYSGNDDFDLVVEMINNHQNLQTGRVISNKFGKT